MITASGSVRPALDEDVLEKVLQAAKAGRFLAALASSSRQLCSLARSRLPVLLWVRNPEQAALLQQSSTHGRPPFSACTKLLVSADFAMDGSVLVPMLRAAVHLTALQKLELREVRGLPLTIQALDVSMSEIISALPSTPHLRSVYLGLPAYGARSAWQLGRLVQLTRLTLVTDLEGSGDYMHTAADLTPLSRLTNLRELVLSAPQAVQPAAGPEGPFALPSSFRFLCLEAGDFLALVGCWVTHLPGCAQLQQLEVQYNYHEHPSAHPSALVPLLAQHTRQLRRLSICEVDHTSWDAPVVGLPDAAHPHVWHPDAQLAALTGLECLDTDGFLFINSAADWQQLAQLSHLTRLAGAWISAAPVQQAGASLALLKLECYMSLGGREVGEVLLACARLHTAEIYVSFNAPQELLEPSATPLAPHASLKKLELYCDGWYAAAPAHFAQLAPVLSAVPSLGLRNWLEGISSVTGASVQLPDLSPCTAVSGLEFGLVRGGGPSWEQEDILSMLAPLSQLRRLVVSYARGLTVRAVVPLQLMLPQLQHVTLSSCGKLLPVPVSVHHQQQQQQQGAAQAQEEQDHGAEQLLAKVRRLLRPGLTLLVNGYCT